MRQFVYASTSKIGFSRTKLQVILDQSQRYNIANEITGLLSTDGKRFAQILEGSDTAIDALMDRIRVDPRHHELIVLTDHQIAGREFGEWSMALRDETGAEVTFNARVRNGLADAPADIQAGFPDLDGEGAV